MSKLPLYQRGWLTVKRSEPLIPFSLPRSPSVSRRGIHRDETLNITIINFLFFYTRM